MKVYLLFPLISILILANCQQKENQDDITYTKELKKQKQINLPIDENTYFVSKSIFQFEENGREYLFLKNIENRLYDFILFDLENQKVIKRIPIEREGPNGVSNALIMYMEKPKYFHMMYDRFRDVYYRFAEMLCELAKNESPYDYFAPKAREFSVIILNDKFDIIGETKFPGNKYFYRMSFVGKDGLYISENNLANPEFDENKLVFSCFKLMDINE